MVKKNNLKGWMGLFIFLTILFGVALTIMVLWTTGKVLPEPVINFISGIFY